MCIRDRIEEAKAYQRDVQFADQSYDPVLTPEDQPAIHLNQDVMARMRPQMEPFYYDPSRYASYLEQIGVDYEAAGRR